MSVRATKWTAWLVLCCLVPVPYMLGGVEIAPLVRLAFLTTVILVLQVSEGSGGLYWWAFIGLGCGQGLLLGAMWYAVATAVARALSRISPGRRRIALLATAAVGIALTAGFQVYETPMSSAAMRSNLWQVFR